jgi:cellulose synthase/poly-beta-1,6-N-acetylglucosamine synthase-like glycosyltransferase
MPPTYPLVSFLIPLRNEEKTLRQCLNSLLSLDYPQDKMEIMLAIGPSSDATKTIAEEYTTKHPCIKILDNPTGNTAIGRNLCIEHSTGEMLMNYSGHVVAEPNLLKALTETLLKQPDDVCAVGCSNLTPPQQSFVAQASGAAFLSVLGGRSFFSQNAVHPTEQFTDHISFALYRRKPVEQVGKFDPEFWCGQDYELDIRLRDAGYKILYTPTTKVLHFKRPSIKSLWRQMYRYGIARAKMVKKHPKTLRFFHLIGPAFILGALLLVILTAVHLIPIWVVPLLIIAYVLLSFISVLQIMRKPTVVIASPIFFLLIHVGYGLGFLRGVVYSKL